MSSYHKYYKDHLAIMAIKLFVDREWERINTKKFYHTPSESWIDEGCNITLISIKQILNSFEEDKNE